MKGLSILLFVLMAFVASAQKTTYHKAYITKKGTYVQGHVQTSPNKSTRDNYSTKGNRNPYTGKTGTAKPTKTSNKVIYTGTNGGRYYINSKGKKTYVKKSSPY